MRYRIIIESEQTTRRPDARSSTPKFFAKRHWQTELAVEGEIEVVVSALRAALSKIDVA